MDSYPHILGSLVNSPWAIMPKALEEIHNIVMARQEGIEADILKIKMETGKSLSNSREITILEKTAIIPIIGPIAKRMNLFMEISGGTSTEILQQDIQKALNSKDVDSIVLNIDSPGGSVDGIFELSDFIYSLRGKKPIFAHANRLMASAAYLIGSAADEIIAYNTSEVGSIGIIAIHAEYSESDKKSGITRSVFTSGQYKGMGNSIEPLTKESKEYIQSQLDYFYGLFISAVARNRNISEDKALTMAEGRIFIGQQASDIGLVDKMGDFNFALQRATKRRKRMDKAELKATHPELVEALQNEGRELGKKEGYEEGLNAGDASGYEKGLKAGQEAELKRVAEIRSCTPPGFEGIANELINKGVSAPEAIKTMLLEHKTKLESSKKANDDLEASKLEDLHLESMSAIDQLKTDKSQGNSDTDVSAQIEQLVADKMFKDGNISYRAALSSVLKVNPKLAAAYQKEIGKG